MTRRWLPAVLLVPALALMAATRLPRADWLGVAFVLGAASALVLAALALRAQPPRWAAAALSFAVAALFLVPPTRASFAPGLPTILAPLAALLFLAALHPQAQARAPGASERSLGSTVRRSLPLALPLLALLALPVLLPTLLPGRLADLQELAGAALPLVVAALLVVPILVVAWLRDAAPLWARQALKGGPPPEGKP